MTNIIYNRTLGLKIVIYFFMNDSKEYFGLLIGS